MFRFLQFFSDTAAHRTDLEDDDDEKKKYDERSRGRMRDEY